MDDLWTTVFRRLDDDDRTDIYSILVKAGNVEMTSPVPELAFTAEERVTARRLVEAIRGTIRES